MIGLNKRFLRLRDQAVEPEDGTTIPIVRNSLRAQQRFQQKNVGAPYGHVKNNKTPSPPIRTSATIDLAAQLQVYVLVHAKLHSFVVIHSEFNCLYIIS